jgi:restriction system protein
MLPLLRFAADGKEHAMREAREKLGEEFGLTEQDKTSLLPSGRRFLSGLSLSCS